MGWLCVQNMLPMGARSSIDKWLENQWAEDRYGPPALQGVGDEKVRDAICRAAQARINRFRFVVLTIALIVAPFPLVELLLYAGLPSWVGNLLQPSLIAVSVTVVAGLWRATKRKRVVEIIEQLQNPLCPACAYNLRGSPSDGQCPECGTSYTQEELREHWQRSLGVY
jgi:hypothetical protein